MCCADDRRRHPAEGRFRRRPLSAPQRQPIECTNVLVEGVTIANRVNPVLCARGVTIDTHGYNNDGCDPENCNYVLIGNCFFNTGDDCIAVKAGRTIDGRDGIPPKTSSSATTPSQTATAASPAAAR